MKMKAFCKAVLLGTVFAGFVGGSAAQAGVVLTSEFPGGPGGPGVNISYTNLLGNKVYEDTMAGAFKMTPVTPAGDIFNAFCVSPEVQVGTGPTTVNASSVLLLNTVKGDFFTHSLYTEDVGNRLAYLLVTAGSGANDLAALSLAIWHTMDKNFSYSTWAIPSTRFTTASSPSVSTMPTRNTGSMRSCLWRTRTVLIKT